MAPQGRDAVVAHNLLNNAGVEAFIVHSLDEIGDAIGNKVGCVLLTEESLRDRNSAMLDAALAAQPVWSDTPFVVLANGATAERTATARERIDALGNVVLLDRPLHADSLVRAVRSALAARARQYEAQDRMDELLQRDQALQESEAKFHAIAESVDQMIFSTLPDGTHDYFNDRWTEFTGVPAGEMPSMTTADLVHPDDLSNVDRATAHSYATGDAFRMEYRLLHHSGSHRWVLGQVKPQRDADGTITRWYGTCTDIHDAVTARDRTLADSRAERDALWNGTRDLLVTISQEGTYREASPSWAEVLGYEPDELVGKAFDALVHPDELDSARAAFEQIVGGTPIFDFALRLQHKDGTYRTIEWNVGMQGEVLFASGRDVTERLEREAELAASEAALRQSQKLETIGQLTGGVAHDFNNLLMATRSSLDLLRRHLPTDNDRAHRFLDNAIKATERGASLTQRMLAFARKQDLHPDSVDVAALLPGLLDLLKRSVGPSVEVDLIVASDLPKALVDTNQLEMAVLNLAVNGRDAMNGTGRLILKADEIAHKSKTKGLEPGQYVRIAVTDTGSGMDASTLAQAMEPFFTTKGVGKGTGLGLSMVHGLASQSGGTFRMDSVVGQGTTAELYLPVAADSEVLDELSEHEEPALRAANDKLTILAVDDDGLVLMGTTGLLEDMGHHVLEAYSGAEALALFETNPDIDILLTDQAMPKMTGTELAATIRAVRPDLPIILASGYAEMPEGAGKNIAARLEKPFGPNELTRAIAAVLKPE